MPELTPKSILVTGAARGIGRAAVRRFMKEGYRVAAFDLPDTDFSKLHEDAAEFNAKLITTPGDVSSQESWDRALEQSVDAFGSIDVLFNNAGIAGPYRGVTGVEPEEFDRVMAVNVRGVYLGLKVIGTHMKQRQQGVIINTSSISGERGGGNVFAYTASKHAVNGMTQSAAVSLARHNVRVLAVCPCPTGTEMVFSLERALAPDEPESMREKLSSGIPMKRYGDPDEIANVVLFLASEQASFMTGALVPVDGGALAN